MYSDMSMRTIASWVSNMNSASARASSVLPTPVGPRNRKVPIGRSGSCRPARERRSALDTASTASSWPITRWCRRSSMWTSFSISPSIRRATGMPVHLATTSATSSASTTLLEEARAVVAVGAASASASAAASSCFSSSGIVPYCSSAARPQVGLALGALELDLGLLEPLLDLGHARRASPSRAATRRASRPSARAPRPARARAARAAPPCPRRRRRPSDWQLDLQLHDVAVDLVDLGRLGVDLHPDPRRGLVDQVDRLVGQEAVGDVALAERRRGDQRRVLDADLVVHLVALLEPAQDRDRVLDASARRRSTGWKRRSSAGSFSMCLRYSSSVVAPTARSSPRASIGLSMLPASIAPSAAPAPTIVCSSSMKTMIWPSASAISLRTALSRSSNSPRYLEPATSAPRSSATSAPVAQRTRAHRRRRCAGPGPRRWRSCPRRARRSGPGCSWCGG